MSKSWMPQETGLDTLLKSDCFSDASTETGIGDEDFVKTLTRFALLYDIPFKYLIPSELYLKQNRISFFHLDTNWLYALMDGALSLGRNISVDYSLDRTIIDKVFGDAVKKTNQIRPELQGKEFPSELDTNSDFSCTGFVMRSPLVSGWRGLEFKAFNGQNELTALRIETIASDVLIGLYFGQITALEILEPPESLHYGFRIEENGAKTKTLRSLENGALYDKETNKKKIVIKERNNRVIDFLQCGKDIESTLPLSPNTVKSSHMALQMIQNANKIRIDLLK